MAYRNCLVIVIAMVLTACQTTPPGGYKLPSVLESDFDRCAPQDGATAMKVFRSEQLLGTLVVEWISEDSRWALEAVDPLGQLLIGVEQKQREFSTRGRLAEYVPPVQVDRRGYLLIDGHWVPLRAREFGCIMSDRWPRTWLTDLNDVDTEGREVEVEFADQKRSITLTHLRAAGNQPGSSCVEMEERGFFAWFAPTLVWCRGQKEREAELRGLQDYRITWKSLDG